MGSGGSTFFSDSQGFVPQDGTQVVASAMGNIFFQFRMDKALDKVLKVF